MRFPFRLGIALLLAAVPTSDLAGQTPADTAAIRATALDYRESWRHVLGRPVARNEIRRWLVGPLYVRPEVRGLDRRKARNQEWRLYAGIRHHS